MAKVSAFGRCYLYFNVAPSALEKKSRRSEGISCMEGIRKQSPTLPSQVSDQEQRNTAVEVLVTFKISTRRCVVFIAKNTPLIGRGGDLKKMLTFLFDDNPPPPHHLVTSNREPLHENYPYWEVRSCWLWKTQEAFWIGDIGSVVGHSYLTYKKWTKAWNQSKQQYFKTRPRMSKKADFTYWYIY